MISARKLISFTYIVPTYPNIIRAETSKPGHFWEKLDFWNYKSTMNLGLPQGARCEPINHSVDIVAIRMFNLCIKPWKNYSVSCNHLDVLPFNIYGSTIQNTFHTLTIRTDGKPTYFSKISWLSNKTHSLHRFSQIMFSPIPNGNSPGNWDIPWQNCASKKLVFGSKVCY